jgi:putative oxidoreductase
MSDIAASPARAPRSLLASIMAVLLPYALVALALRLIVARVFFLSGQDKIEGLLLRIHVDFANIGDVWVTLPTQIKQSTFDLFASKYAALPIPTHVTAYAYTYAEFLLPICLAIGFATRLSALVLLVMTVLMTIYVTPQTFWSAQVYWAAILLVLMSAGPGALSFDALFRYLSTRDRAPEYR